MSILFDCPFCSYDKTVPDTYYGKKIKCPRCLATLTLGIPQPTALTALPLPDDEESPVNQTAIEVDKSDSLVECPYCFELINSQEKKCPYCKRYLDEAMASKVDTSSKQEESSVTEGDGTILENYMKSIDKAKQTFSWGLLSLIFGLGLFFGPIAIWCGLKTRAMFWESLETSKREMVTAGISMGIVGIVGSVSLLTGCILYLFVFSNNPF